MTRSRSARSPWLRLVLWLAVPPLMVWSLRQTDLREIGRTLGQLGTLEIVVLAAVNFAAVAALAARWWVLMAADGVRLPYLAVTLYRLAGFGITYFTPGTQFGGEPLQVHLVHRRHGIANATATASVVLDRILELIVNFAFVAVGMAVVVSLGIYPQGTAGGIACLAVLLMAAPLAYLAMIWAGRAPVTHLVTNLSHIRWFFGRIEAIRLIVGAAEAEVIRMARKQPAGILLGLLASAVAWGVLLLEWWLVLAFLGMELDPARLIAVVTATRLALFVPVPGALGALEASLVLSLTALGFRAEQALGAAVFVRLRDVAFAGAGLWIGGALAGERPSGASKEQATAEPKIGPG